jgi:hypothetical protein
MPRRALRWIAPLLVAVVASLGLVGGAAAAPTPGPQAGDHAAWSLPGGDTPAIVQITADHLRPSLARPGVAALAVAAVALAAPAGRPPPPARRRAVPPRRAPAVPWHRRGPPLLAPA